MATVASVYSVPRYKRQPEDIIGDQRDPPERPAIHDKRVWASVRQDAKTVIGSAFREATHRDPHHQREWVVLVDGEPHQLNTIKALAKQQGLEVTIVLDCIHVLDLYANFRTSLMTVWILRGLAGDWTELRQYCV